MIVRSSLITHRDKFLTCLSNISGCWAVDNFIPHINPELSDIPGEDTRIPPSQSQSRGIILSHFVISTGDKMPHIHEQLIKL